MFLGAVPKRAGNFLIRFSEFLGDFLGVVLGLEIMGEDYVEERCRRDQRGDGRQRVQALDILDVRLDA